jgi:hypothetical protein
MEIHGRFAANCSDIATYEVWLYQQPEICSQYAQPSYEQKVGKPVLLKTRSTKTLRHMKLFKHRGIGLESSPLKQLYFKVKIIVILPA